MQASVKHPLEPLTAAEITAAVEIVRSKQSVGAQYRFPCVTLHEPEKSVVIAFQPRDMIHREAFLILLDNATGHTYESVIDLTQGTVKSWQHIPHVQPNLMADEVAECEGVVKAHPDFKAAIAQRGITDLDLVVVDAWAMGHFGFKDEEGIRLSRCLCYLRSTSSGNFYSRPIDGLVACELRMQAAYLSRQIQANMPKPLSLSFEKISSRCKLRNPKAQAFKSMVITLAGKSGSFGLGLRRVREWCSIPWVMKIRTSCVPFSIALRCLRW
jgi:Cu2+-containing amine oxidase